VYSHYILVLHFDLVDFVFDSGLGLSLFFYRDETIN
jgi:hypothetical protein